MWQEITRESTVTNPACKRLSALKEELTALDAQPWSNIGSWIAKATPAIRSDWSHHFDDFQQNAAEPRWTTPRLTLSELKNAPQIADKSVLPINMDKAEAAKQKILGFLDGLMTSSEAPVPTPQSLATIFYSWQSDLPNSTNRGFIGDCLERAIKELRADPNLRVDPCLDRDTQNVPGSPDIASTIFDKIDNCGLFVCDVSIVNPNSSQRTTPNPNVLIELGYAVKTLGWSRIVCVFNGASGRIQDLPFDLRQRRVRSYTVHEGDEKTDQRKLLVGMLKADLGNIFNAMLPRQGTMPEESRDSADIHSIRFAVDDWKVWREPDHDLGAAVIINGWREGCIRYSCTIRLRNELGSDEEIHRLRIEFRQGDTVLLADTYAFDDRGVTLPPRKWVSRDVCHGLHDDGVFVGSDSVWFVAETVGDNSKVEWQVAAVKDSPIQSAEEFGEDSGKEQYAE
jgi:hypothetical protein